MPYKLVVTKNGPNEEVSAVPEGWVVGTYLYWPRSRKKSNFESLRSNEKSIPDKSWKKMKCRLKLSDICSYEEALQLEDLYSFQDTEVEEMNHKERQNKNQIGNTLPKQILDIHSEFDGDENNVTVNVIGFEEVMVKKPDENIIKNVNDDIGTSTNTDDVIKIKTSELVNIVQENNSLKTENKALKEELLRSVESHNETTKNLQTQLEKIFDLLQNKYQGSSSIMANNGLKTSEGGSDKIILGSLMFPIETKEQLEALENKLLEKDVMTNLVKKFSEICGTNGNAKISKVGLNLMKNIIKDELLRQFTWKGIKGSTKTAFIQYVNIRELFYKVARLADQSCSFRDSDSFLQNSAIKFSGQRIKRQILSSESRMNVKKMKKEINKSEKYSSNKIIPDTESTDGVSDNEIKEEVIDIVLSEEKDEESTDIDNDNELDEDYSYAEINH